MEASALERILLTHDGKGIDVKRDALNRLRLMERQEGMRRAASVYASRQDGRPTNGKWGGEYQRGWDDSTTERSKAILTAAEQLK